ncbi:SLC13 family permease [Nicoliella lavandulae]|uniref:SLC13 family permease n=1 Tax=Nicoliella lavandulae TaxID=3082954 RepID=A0ABU8SK64_9LACO
MLNQIKKIFTDKLLIISFIVLLLVGLIGTPSFADLNWTTIGALFSLMAVVGLLNHFNLLTIISEKLIMLIHNRRQFVQLMVLISFISAMVMTNDVAIISIVPLYLFTAQRYQMPRLLPTTLITIAANLGSMVTPFGNPQNLFLFNAYHYVPSTFFVVTVPMGMISLGALFLMTQLIDRRTFTADAQSASLPSGWPLWLTIGLALIVLAGVFDLLPIGWVVLITILMTLIINRRTLLSIDYSLLLTFACFFLITGILSRNGFVTHTLEGLMQGRTGTYLTSIVTSQVISNVPAAVLLSKFSHDANAILLGVNIGGLGTLVASLANLLALKQFAQFDKQHVGAFIKQFTIVNVILLVSLGIIGWIMLII